MIAALCDALVLVEARERSGGLITVRWAADLGRSVFAVPGQTDNPLAAGCLALIRDGVSMIRDVRDLLLDLDWNVAGSPLPQSSVEVDVRPTLTAAEQRLLAVLDHEARSLDLLLPALDQSPGQVLTGLLALELKGLVRQEEGMRFRKCSDE